MATLEEQAIEDEQDLSKGNPAPSFNPASESEIKAIVHEFLRWLDEDRHATVLSGSGKQAWLSRTASKRATLVQEFLIHTRYHAGFQDYLASLSGATRVNHD